MFERKCKIRIDRVESEGYIMRDVHVHFLHGNSIGYTMDFLRVLLKPHKMQGLTKYTC